MRSVELTRVGPVKWLVSSRWPQLVVTALLLGGLLLAIVAGLAGTPVGNRNFAIVGVWIAWWAALMLIAVPLFGRAWCGVCPVGAVGDWLQRGAILEPSGSRFGLGLHWPRALRNLWLQNGAFAALALVSVVILTHPRVTGWLLLALPVAAVVTSLVFERRTFCRYLCPVGGFIGLYSQLAPVELRVKDRRICAGHRNKTCYTGSPAGAGCPWLVYPGALDRNSYCGLCMECVRTCPYDNVAVNRRWFGADVAASRAVHLDEAFKAFLMLGSAIAYSAVLLGPWGGLKAAAHAVGSGAWFAYAAAFLAFAVGVVPGAFFVAAWISRAVGAPLLSVRQTFLRYTPVVVPLGLTAWIAFSLSFVFANFAYVWPVLSDPMGRGWNLIGTVDTAWSPYLATITPGLQVGVLLVGLAWATGAALRVAKTAVPDGATTAQAIPIVAFCLLATVGLMGLLVG